MKKSNILYSAGITFAVLSFGVINPSQVYAMNGAHAPSLHTEAGKRIIDRDGKYAKTATIKLCVDYHKEKSEAERKTIIEELDLRAQLSEKDHNLAPKNQIENGMTMCGMYMSIGTPKAHKTKQIRPMVYKTVHIYPNHYVVTQSGMVVQIHAREEGKLPPKLAAEKPAVEPSPTLKH